MIRDCPYLIFASERERIWGTIRDAWTISIFLRECILQSGIGDPLTYAMQILLVCLLLLYSIPVPVLLLRYFSFKRLLKSPRQSSISYNYVAAVLSKGLPYYMKVLRLVCFAILWCERISPDGSEFSFTRLNHLTKHNKQTWKITRLHLSRSFGKNQSYANENQNWTLWNLAFKDCGNGFSGTFDLMQGKKPWQP